jgi:hypothetical protein
MGESFFSIVLALTMHGAYAAQAPVEVAQAAPPPTIVNVRATGRYCEVLQKSIGPGILGLMQNDRTIFFGMFELRAMQQDGGTLRLKMDEMRLETDVSNITRNLAAIDHVLAAPEPPELSAEESRKAEGMKSALRTVARQQLLSLNTLDGTLESTQANAFANGDDMQNFAFPMQIDKNESTHEAVQRNPDPGAVATVSDRNAVTMAPGAGDFFPDLRHAEDQAAQAVIAGAKGCKPVNGALKL